MNEGTGTRTPPSPLVLQELDVLSLRSMVE